MIINRKNAWTSKGLIFKIYLFIFLSISSMSHPHKSFNSRPHQFRALCMLHCIVNDLCFFMTYVMMRVIGHRPPWFVSLSITKLSIAMMMTMIMAQPMKICKGKKKRKSKAFIIYQLLKHICNDRKSL